MPLAGIDASWRFGINQASEQHLRFGPDISFTFGPYTSIYTGQYSPSTDALMIGSSLLLALGYAAALIFLMGRERQKWGVVTVLILAGLFLLKDVLFFSFPLLVALVTHRIVTRGSLKRLSVADFFFPSLLCFALGLLPLVKGTFLIGSISILGCCFVYLVGLGYKRLAGTILIAFFVGVLFFWLLSGQSLADLPIYLANLIPTVSGYTEAMAVDGDQNQVTCYLLAACITLLAILFDRRLRFSSRYFLIAVYALYLFIAFKGGFVRHDGHALMAGVGILLGAVVLLIVSRSKTAYVSLVFALVAWLVVDLQYQKTSTEIVLNNIDAANRAAWNGIASRFEHPLELRREYDDAVALIRHQANYPVLPGTSDIYSYDQSQLIASGNRWAPRPILQSYSAYTPAMLEQNRLHLVAAGAPDHLFFKVQTIDGRFPSTEDGASWPELLARYRPTRFDRDVLILERVPDASPPLLEPVDRSITAKRGTNVAVPDSVEQVFATIRIRRSLLGSLYSLLYKPDALQMEVSYGDSTHKSFRIVSAMVASPFLVSPVIDDTKDFLLLYGDHGLLDNKRIRSFSVSTTTSGSWMWADEFSVNFFALQPHPQEGITDLLGMKSFGEAVTGGIVGMAACEGNIDTINDKPAGPASLNAQSVLKLEGWITDSIHGPGPVDRIYAVMTDGLGKATLLKGTQTPRPDVAAYYKIPTLANVGFAASSQLKEFHGHYLLGLAIERNGSITQCPQFKFPIDVQ